MSRKLLAVAAIAAALLFIAFILWNRQSTAWAQVVEAVSKKPWLHAVTILPDGTKGEMWFSPNRAIMACRGGEQIFWLDCRRNIVKLYVPQKDTIVIQKFNIKDQKGLIYTQAIFIAFLSGKAGQTVEAGSFKLVHQQQRDVNEDGKHWIEHRFKRHNEEYEIGALDRESIVYVDPETQLPFRWEEIPPSNSSHPKSEYINRCDIDYPPNGPEDIFVLGVPNTAKELKPVTDDVEQLKAEVHSVRWQPERYYALIVESWDKQHWSQGYGVHRIWRSGPKWKVERSFGPVTRFSEKLAPGDADPATWWREKAAKLRFVQYKLCDGKWLWEYQLKTRIPTPEDIAAGAPEDTMVLLSIEKKRDRPIRAENYWDIDDYSNKGRPFFSLDPFLEATIDNNPKSGPPNTILLEVRNPDWKPVKIHPPELPTQIPRPPQLQIPQIQRYWIDPERSYLVMRDENIITVDGKEEMTTGFAIEGVSQSPQGQWFPTVIRYLKGVQNVDDSASDYIERYYYDFNAPMPDSLFEP